MIIKCQSINDFLKNLTGEVVYLGRVYVDRTLSPANGTSLRDASSWDVTLQVSAILNLGDDEQALVLSGEDCGVHRESGQYREGEISGKERADELRTKIIEFCDDAGLKVKPGILDM